MSNRQRLEELDIRFWNFYKAKKKYRLQDEAAATAGFTFLSERKASVICRLNGEIWRLASEALVYIGDLYRIESEMNEEGLSAEAKRKRQPIRTPTRQLATEDRHCQVVPDTARVIPSSGGYTLSQSVKTYFVGGLLKSNDPFCSGTQRGLSFFKGFWNVVKNKNML